MDLFGIVGPYWVLIYISGSLFSLFWLHLRKECQFFNICRHWFWFTLLTNFYVYLCLRINFHISLFWVLILADGGPYWVLISQKKWVLIWSLSQSLEVPNSFRDSAMEEMQRFYRLLTYNMNVSSIETSAAFFSWST